MTSIGQDPPCQTEACSLHDCLKKHTYSPEKCDRHLRNLYECCQRMYDQTKGKGESTACPMPQVVARWIKDHPRK
ncbi:Cx9C motif-containing protein 4, mitochondrial [Psilocybe cubensis]|uniref:Cx9C motif-containing protein 4, mitochondrial n=1 Tax=Psilocybe cubensis TaxID=181762 RepID=A0ACB8HDQ8_PSICU|nr:Cx9C motif-containing protein 4, mitochondrial [Psilocybe cubensis]KAH9485837.1 Cx9C motif-containing protein 4, mitochondrial [Psilocybe cubensis]